MTFARENLRIIGVQVVLLAENHPKKNFEVLPLKPTYLVGLFNK